MRRALSAPVSVDPAVQSGGVRVTIPAHPVAVDAGRLWAGGVATAVVAALVALLGVLLAQGALDIAMVEPPLLPVPGSFAFRYALTAGVLALLATALAHLLVSTAPRPRSFFSWIVGLTTAVG